MLSKLTGLATPPAPPVIPAQARIQGPRAPQTAAPDPRLRGDDDPQTGKDARNASSRGFTLIEIVIAFTIASLAIIALLRGGGDGVSAVVTAGHYQEALSRARSHLAALGQTATIKPQTLDGDDGDGYRWYLTVTRVATAAPRPPSNVQVGVQSTAPSLALYRVEVSIGWRDGGKARKLTLESQRLGPPEKPEP